METNDQNLNELNQEKMELTHESIGYLDQIRKWTTFFSILGFIGIAFMFIVGIFIGSIFSKIFPFANSGFPFSLIGIIYFILGIIYFFPALYLYRFSIYSKNAVKNNDSNEIGIALKNLKSHFKFLGILMIIILSIYLLIGIGALIVSLIK